MIKLINQCYCSTPKVFPNTWNTIKATVKKDWYIYYRFYDPLFKDNPKYKKGKLIIIKGMNHLRDVKSRKNETHALIKEELVRLIERGYNPITNFFHNDTINTLFEIHHSTPFIDALHQANKLIKASKSTKRDLKSIIGLVQKAAVQLRYSDIPVNTISRKHIKTLLGQIEVNQGYPSVHRYNKVRTYLILLYNELLDLEAVQSNPVLLIKKQKDVQKLRQLLSYEKRLIINDYLFANHYRFRLFMQIFFHSGSRLTEMMLVKRKHVDLKKQAFIVTIKKGSFSKEVEKPIKNIALDYWCEAMKNANCEDYIFSKNLYPGTEPINTDQITKRWNRHVKKKLGITQDFYSLKHSNLDEIASILGIDEPAIMASHTFTAITIKHYAVNETQRKNDKVKGVKNAFAEVSPCEVKS